MNIYDIRMPDGTAVDSPMAAVEKFKCPGPCGPDCPLYKHVRVRGDEFGHLCHPEIVRRYPTKILDEIGCTYSTGLANKDCPGKARPNGRDRLYAAVIRSGAVRDVQVCRDSEHDPMSDNWYDYNDAEVWLGLFWGPGALQQAADYADTDADNIRLIPVPDERDDPGNPDNHDASHEKEDHDAR